MLTFAMFGVGKANISGGGFIFLPFSILVAVLDIYAYQETLLIFCVLLSLCSLSYEQLF